MEPNGHMLRYLPHALLATGLIAGIPVALGWTLAASGTVTSPLVLIGVTVAVSLLGFQVGAALWKRHPGAGDMLFGELMIWGWLRRLWSERRLARAVRRIGPADGADNAGPEERAERLRQLSAALEAADPYTHGHSRRVAHYSATIAKGLHLDPEEVARIHTAATVHDVGKLRTPATVLRKPGGLTDEEIDVIHRHATDGAEMVAVLDEPDVTLSVRHHHERLDGSGYPDGLRGIQIPLGARIIAVADTFDAIASTRPYRRARTHREALAVLTSEAGTHLDPHAVRAFVGHYSDSRPLAFWTVLAAMPERIAAAFGGALNAGSAAVAGLAVATVAAAGSAVADLPPAAAAPPTAAFAEITAVCEIPEASADAADSAARPAVRARAATPRRDARAVSEAGPTATLAGTAVSAGTAAPAPSTGVPDGQAPPTEAPSAETPPASPAEPEPPAPPPSTAEPDPPAPPPDAPPADAPPSCELPVLPQLQLVCLDHLPPSGG
jgi:hypothetical protein